MFDDYTINKLMDGKAVFLNYWILASKMAKEIERNYGMALLPGRNEELSSTSINGFNVGINKLLETKYSESGDVSNAEKLEAALKVTEYITSKDFQKKLFIKKDIVASMPSLLEDEDVCKANDCELYKNMQPIPENIFEKSSKNYDRNAYEFKYRDIVINYLYNNDVDLEDTLRTIDDITKIHYASLDKISSVGFITAAVIITVAFLMLLSLVFIFFENYQPFFEFFSIDSWFILIFGIIIVLSSSLLNIGEVTVNKCHLKSSLLEIGITVYLSIILYQLIINLPSEIKLIEWIKKHKYLFLLFFYLNDILFTGLTILNPYNIKTIIVEDGHNYQLCKMENIYGKLIFIIMSSEKVFYVLLISFLIFVEWNMNKIYYELRFIMFAIYSDLLLLSLTVIINFINFKNYYVRFIIKQSILLFIYVLSYTSLYGFKLILALLRKKDLKITFINKIYENFVNSSGFQTQKSIEDSFTNYKTEKTVEDSGITVTATNDISSDNSSRDYQRKKSLYAKIISYHYSTFTSNDENGTPS